MPYTYEQLKSKTIAGLRDIAKELSNDAIQGYSQMNKEHLSRASPEQADSRAHVVEARRAVQTTVIGGARRGKRRDQ